jgi:hypothetical protein
MHALGEVHVLAAGDDGVVTRLGVVDGPEVAEVGGVWVHQLEDVVAVLYLRHVDHDGLALEVDPADRVEGVVVGGDDRPRIGIGQLVGLAEAVGWGVGPMGRLLDARRRSIRLLGAQQR